MHDRKATLQVLVSIGAVQVLAMVVALLRSKALSLLLGPAGFGVVSTIDQTASTLVILGGISLPFTAMKFMARSHSDGDDAFQRTFASFLRALSVLAVGTVGVVLTILVLRPGTFGADMGSFRVPLAIGVVGVPAAMLNILFINTLASAQRPAASAVLGLLTATSLAVGGVAGQVVGGLPGLYVGTLLAGVVNTFGALVFLHRRLGLALVGRATSLLAELRRSPEIASYSLMLYAAVAAYSLTVLATRYFVLSSLGAAQAGLLQSLVSLGLTLGAVMNPMSNLFLTPLVNRRIGVEQKIAAANDFAGKMAVLLLLAALPLVLFPRLVIVLLYSGKFAPAAGVLFLFIAWQCLYQLVNVYLQLLIGLDDVAWYAVVTCASYACAAGLFPVLVPRLGLPGVALALATAMLVSGFCAVVRLRTKFGCRVAGATAVRAALVLGVVLAAGIVFRDSAGERSLPGIGARVGFAVTAAGVLWTLLGADERTLVTSVVSRALGGRPRMRADAV